jgi:hypothetical protein
VEHCAVYTRNDVDMARCLAVGRDVCERHISEGGFVNLQLELAQYRRGTLRRYLTSTAQEVVRINRSMLLWSIGFWLLVPICWIPVLVADTTPWEKDLGLGVLAMACVLLSLAVAAVALILTFLCIADYVQRRHKSRTSLANERSSP